MPFRQASFRYLLLGIFSLLLVFPVLAVAGDRYDYLVTVASDVAGLSVRIRFNGEGRAFKLKNAEAAGLTQNLNFCNERDPIERQGNEFTIKPADPACLYYEVNLAGLDEEERFGVKLTDDNRRVPVASWLWLPPLRGDTEIRVRFILGNGINVSVPWEPVTGEAAHSYKFGPSPESGEAISLFGRFENREIHISGATLRVSLLKGELPMQEVKILRWLRATATDVALAYGRFPNPLPQIIIVPVAKKGKAGRSAVPFGHIIRDGGEAVQFFVDQTRPLEDFLGDWTATHEFSHLMLPYIDSDQKWISEGFASYYQNVLLARAGVYTARQAWQNLYEGFQRARKESDAISPNQAGTMRLWDARMMVYWSGAALALMADVKLRRLSQGGESLDSVLGKLQACCLPSDKTWDGRKFFSKLDEMTPYKIFMGLYTAYADSPGLPDLSEDFQALGINIIGGKVHLLDTAADRTIRDAIMQVDEAFARSRGKDR